MVFTWVLWLQCVRTKAVVLWCRERLPQLSYHVIMSRSIWTAFALLFGLLIHQRKMSCVSCWQTSGRCRHAISYGSRSLQTFCVRFCVCCFMFSSSKWPPAWSHRAGGVWYHMNNGAFCVFMPHDLIQPICWQLWESLVAQRTVKPWNVANGMACCKHCLPSAVVYYRGSSGGAWTKTEENVASFRGMSSFPYQQCTVSLPKDSLA